MKECINVYLEKLEEKDLKPLLGCALALLNSVEYILVEQMDEGEKLDHMLDCGGCVLCDTRNILNYNWRTVENYGCVVSVEDGVIFTAPLLRDWGIDLRNVAEVTHPDSQKFLDEVNKLFGTNFQMSDFDR